MLNASTVKKWLVDSLGAAAVPLHMVACSSALDKTAAFGIDDANVFGFWDWVGGRELPDRERERERKRDTQKEKAFTPSPVNSAY